jgi:taurine transport system permease protein
MLYGTLGIVLVSLFWWTLTYPFFTETRERREYVGSNEYLNVADPVTGEPLQVERPSYVVHTERIKRAIVNPPALDTPGNTARDALHLLTASGPNPSLLEHIAWSSLRIVLGFMLSIVVALPLGIAMGLFPRMRALVNPMISFLRPLPSISWVPLAMIWLGAGELQKLAIVFMGSFAAALIYTIEATIKVDPNLIRAAQNLGIGSRQLLSRVLLPAALPNILSGMKVVLAIAWTCVISAEIVGTQVGLGSLIWTSKETSHTAAVLVGMACISSVVLVMDALFERLERRLVPWMHIDAARKVS